MRRQATRASSTNSDNSSIGWRWHKAFRLPRSDRSWGRNTPRSFSVRWRLPNNAYMSK